MDNDNEEKIITTNKITPTTGITESARMPLRKLFVYFRIVLSIKSTESLDLSKKMDCYASCPAFIIIKDHKRNFRNNTKCRLINPAKNELGVVSKKHLEEIIVNVANTIKINQWRNTTTAID